MGAGDLGESESPPIPGGVEAQRDQERGTAVYRSMKHPLEFSGRMLIGREFIDVLYVHMGFQAPYTYREVFELVFEKGHLVESRDLSEGMADVRSHIDDHGGRPNRDLISWIEERLSLEY